MDKVDLTATIQALHTQQALAQKELGEVRLALLALTKPKLFEVFQFEAVIPKKDPAQKTVSVFGKSISEVVNAVRAKWEKENGIIFSGGMANVYLFLNVKGNVCNISIAISPKDVPKGITGIAENFTDKGGRHRAVWGDVPEERGSAYL